MNEEQKRYYDKGYEAGESNNHADWDLALDDLLPHNVEAYPSKVSDYIRKLHQARKNLENLIYIITDQPRLFRWRNGRIEWAEYRLPAGQQRSWRVVPQDPPTPNPDAPPHPTELLGKETDASEG